MRFIQKYTFFGILLLMSLLLDYGTFFINNDAAFVSELGSESNTATTSFSSDTQICEDDQIFHKTKMLMFSDNKFQANYFQIFSLLPHPYFTVWQPPKSC